MSNTEENEVLVTEPVPEDENAQRKPRFIEEAEEASVESPDETEEIEEVSEALENEIDDETEPASEAPVKKKKKRPFIQVPVIISICLVAASLLAYLSYHLLWITEPEGVTWVWASETDNVNWYYEFKDDNVFKAYVGSFEVTASYEKDKSEEAVNKLMVTSGIPYAQSLGCIFFSAEMKYNINGLRISGGQEMTISYTDDPEQQEYVLKQTDYQQPTLELPDDFKEDKDLTGEWINIYSTADAKQTIQFNDDGSMVLCETYNYSDESFSEIRRNCTYTVADNEIDITWEAEEAVVHHSEYKIADGILAMDGAYYYREGNHPATPDETK